VNNAGDPTVDDLAVSSKKGVECILEIMRKFPFQESLQTTALFALGSIVMKSRTRK
jgi:hypothetical protein